MKRKYISYSSMLLLSILSAACGVPKVAKQEVHKALPTQYDNPPVNDNGTNMAEIDWQDYFHDPYLTAIIYRALQHNQDLLITMQKIEITANEVMARHGEYLPSVGIKAEGGIEKRSENTPLGAMERQVEIRHGKENPEPMPDVGFALVANWEIDIWKKLRNAT